MFPVDPAIWMPLARVSLPSVRKGFVVPVASVPQPAPPAPPAGADPAVAVTAAPQPGFVGGQVTVTYTVHNIGGRAATGLSLAFGLPPGVAATALPGGCTVAGCPALPDLVPGSAAGKQRISADIGQRIMASARRAVALRGRTCWVVLRPVVSVTGFVGFSVVGGLAGAIAGG